MKVKIKYSLKDKNTGYFTKYRTKTINIEIPVNDHGIVIHAKLSAAINQYLASITAEPFHLLTYSF